MSEDIESYNIIYLKVQEVIANVGGMGNVIYFILLFISS
jgi:hypothetical protein